MIKFTEEECKSIIKYSEYLEENHSSVIFSNKKKTFDYFYYTLIRNESTQWIFDRFKLYLEEFFESNTLDKHPQLYLHRYPAGCKFERHNDSTTHPDQLINIGACLNSEYVGGDFIFYNPDEVLPKIPGTIYHMDSKRDHEVLEITEGERWSLITFLKQKDLGIKSTNLL